MNAIATVLRWVPLPARRGLSLIIATFLSSFCLATENLDSLFSNPPRSAKPWVYWFWMDGNVSREGISADLRAMNEVGLGGVILMEVDVGVPRGPVRFMSPEWRQLFGHAVRDAERLGLEITLNAGPGWTGSGGPWVKPEQSMQHLVASSLVVHGPARFHGTLPRPTPRKPHFVHAPLPASTQSAYDSFYRDVAVVAFPESSAGSSLSDVDEKALYYRLPYSSHPNVKAFLGTPVAPSGDAKPGGVRTRDLIDLSERLQPDGSLSWDVPEGTWTLLRFGRTSTGANTRPAPEPGIGLESDKFDADALDAHFEAFVGTLLGETGRRPRRPRSGWTMLHIDSWEMGAQNWSGRFRDEFRRRRRYDPLPYLPTLTGRIVESASVSERFLWDLRQTAQELVIHNHARRLRTLGKRHGLGLSIEPYDMNPCADLSLGAVADIPMCEFWSAGFGFETAFSCIESISIGHTLGRPIIAAEAFTADAPEAWQLYPGRMKPQADWALALGINRLVFHRYAHQPWLDRQPGMTMGPYGVHYERTQTWWPMTPAWHGYLARCQALLQHGSPVADLCILAPEGAPYVFRAPPSLLTGSPVMPDRREYSFDACSPEVLVQYGRVDHGRLILPGGAAYQVLVLPEIDAMTPKLLRVLRGWVKAGLTIVGTRPLRSPSLTDYPDCDREIAALAQDLWGPTSAVSDTSPPARRWGRGWVWERPLPTPSPDKKDHSLHADFQVLQTVLRHKGVAPDFESNLSLRYTHRRDRQADWYFLSHRENSTATGWGWFRVQGQQPELWDPLTGTTRLISEFETIDGRTRIPLTFGPNQSCFIVFRGRPLAKNPPTDPESEINSRSIRIQIEHPWEVSFEPGFGGPPESLRMEALTDWSRHPDPRVRSFSGRATYRTTVASPIDGPLPEGTANHWYLDLGRVEVVAQVKCNGVEVGTAWTTPFRVDITAALRPGTNHLEVTVANLWPNRLIADQSMPPNQRVTWTTWNPYRPNATLLPSGLLGPVALVNRPDRQ
ncbi:MAG: hypothetical protein JNK85_27255 [Verrucomicrobiales bacterium]|nr:hypothetical protein [Verrucomicrobiales bacterium]